MKLRRLNDDGYATRGQLVTDEEKFVCYTLELPWQDNQHGVSCIPPGAYTARRRWSPKHQCSVFGVEGVPNRSDIEIHPANWPSQLLGCIALGETFAVIEGKPGIANSRAAFRAFMDEMAGIDEFPLTVLPPEDAQGQDTLTEAA